MSAVVFLAQNGFPAEALLIEKRASRILMQHVLETKPKPQDPKLVVTASSVTSA